MGDTSEDAPESRAATTRREFIGGAAVVLTVVGAVVGKRVARALSPAPTRAQCEALLSRWLSHASRQRDPAVDDEDVAGAEALARTKPEYLADVDRCQRELTAEEVACGIESTYEDALERCVQ